jgi:hypothetical protein
MVYQVVFALEQFDERKPTLILSGRRFPFDEYDQFFSRMMAPIQPPLQTPTSDTPVAGALVALPPGKAGR